MSVSDMEEIAANAVRSHADAMEKVGEMRTCLRVLLELPAWLVWSNERMAWWMPERGGYTSNVAMAGRYDLAEAQRCCELRSKRPDGVPCEVVVPSPEWIGHAEAIKRLLP